MNLKKIVDTSFNIFPERVGSCTIECKEVSSANNLTSEFTLSGKSFMYGTLWN